MDIFSAFSAKYHIIEMMLSDIKVNTVEFMHLIIRKISVFTIHVFDRKNVDFTTARWKKQVKLKQLW